MRSIVVVTATVPFCVDDPRFYGSVRVVEVVPLHGHKTIGLRLYLKEDRYVILPRHRLDEVIAAQRAAGVIAADQYRNVIREMNP
jgi:hypothetical protein